MQSKKDTRDSDSLIRLYEGHFGVLPTITPIPGAGSDRRYYRLSAPEVPSAVGTIGTDRKENETFIALSEVFGKYDVPVPYIYAVSDDRETYLQEDLGSTSLLDMLEGAERLPLSGKALKHLVNMQIVPEEKWGGVVMHSPFSKRQAMWDLNYFKYEFLKAAAIAFDENKLEDDFEAFADSLTKYDKRLAGFMYRDFQSRNVMVKDAEVYFIDYQGGRKGPMTYDVASFLWQAKAGFSNEERELLMDIYADALSRVRGIGKEEINGSIRKMALFRTLQVLGSYGFRGLVEKRAHFIESIPAALANLKDFLEEGALSRWKELERAARLCVESRFAGKDVSEDGKDDTLTVTVFSFSYKKGYPEDLTGNGGGFMFDCRGMHNPGRYEKYKPLTGRDRDVIEFLEERGEVQKFVEIAVELVSPTVARYLQRGFKSLQVGFGCTGGRHRSVYCAENFSRDMKQLFPKARVVLIHREQGIKEEK